MKGSELKKKREACGWTQQYLAELAGVTKRTVINWEQSENITRSKVNLLHSVFNQHDEDSNPKELSVNEPLEIFNTKAGSNYEELPSGKYLLTVPLVPVRAQATYISEFADADYIGDLNKVSFIVDRVGRGSYRAFEIQNDSMNDGTIESIPDGSIVLGRELGKQHWKSKLNMNGYPYWIIVHKSTILCKQIIKHDVDQGIITCHSLNESPEFPDFEISLNDCHQIFNIIKKQI